MSLKEKWLDEDPEKISVLKYVATFEDRLFRAGQMAKRNLQESESKMKVWYDRKTKLRFLNLEIEYWFCYTGPYKVVKKISNTNYLVITPGRCKETQVCHINMLKAYHEKLKPELVTLNNKLGLENPMHSEDCADLEAEKEEDTEREVRLGNDQQSIKLQNSQIFNYLRTKLSHLTLRHVMPVFLVQGYWQVPLTQRAREISKFVTRSSFISTRSWRLE